MLDHNPRTVPLSFVILVALISQIGIGVGPGHEGSFDPQIEFIIRWKPHVSVPLFNDLSRLAMTANHSLRLLE